MKYFPSIALVAMLALSACSLFTTAHPPEDSEQKNLFITAQGCMTLQDAESSTLSAIFKFNRHLDASGAAAEDTKKALGELSDLTDQTLHLMQSDQMNLGIKRLEIVKEIRISYNDLTSSLNRNDRLGEGKSISAIITANDKLSALMQGEPVASDGSHLSYCLAQTMRRQNSAWDQVISKLKLPPVSNIYQSL